MASTQSNRQFFLHPSRKAWKQVFSPRHEDMCKTPQPPQSEGRICAIFKKSNFSRLDIIRGLDSPIDTWLDPKYTIDDEFYNRIRPALVLATRFCIWTSEFFNILMFGEFIYDDTKIKYDRFTEPEHRPRMFPDMMDNLHNMQFFTGYHRDTREDTYASTYFGTYPKDYAPQMPTTAVQLNTKFTTFFTHYHYNTFTADVKNMVLVSLAITLVHELVHVWYNLRRLEIARLGDLTLCRAMHREPYFFGDEKKPELGMSWEHFTFRGMPQLHCPGNKPYAQAKGLLLVPLLESGGEEDEVMVDPEVVRALLDRECWEMYERLLIGDLAPTFRSVSGMGILERMKTAVVLMTFKNKAGRLPFVQELLEAKGAMSCPVDEQQPEPVQLPSPESPKSTLSTGTEMPNITVLVQAGHRRPSPPALTPSDDDKEARVGHANERVGSQLSTSHSRADLPGEQRAQREEDSESTIWTGSWPKRSKKALRHGRNQSGHRVSIEVHLQEPRNTYRD
ncbi:hypothetical protein Z517_05335 [Fonsecaea pedrosoi CBS 271.37]|uniref:Uncharacterized protein n=1 Tax=Fonsecaea pedrosoi CBS 271.37 TaxID=1442368 RepID=A0A0D2GMW2_9EURO|nr:uncharacterized protein Z517_05335 [Fonsecaea pedrosoi CBS 271.37]KIW82308.1 hypothetical protein Z517_05335 [Fonsecaea pedrosoi CBS 271.37]